VQRVTSMASRLVRCLPDGSAKREREESDSGRVRRCAARWRRVPAAQSAREAREGGLNEVPRDKVLAASNIPVAVYPLIGSARYRCFASGSLP